MQHDIISAAGVRMPPLIYGTAWKKERTAALVEEAIRAGFRGIDTACQPRHYEEALVGEALEQMQREGIKREALFLQTKFTPPEGQDPATTPYDRDAPVQTQVADSFEVSRRNLRTDYVDSLVLHSPLFPFSQLRRAWSAMESIAKSGGARQLGISNCYELKLLQRLYAEADVKPAVLQNRFYADTGYDIELREWCDANDIVYQSFWTLSANPLLLDSRQIRTLARKYAKTPSQILFGYLHQVGVIPLCGTTSRQHMREGLESFEIELAPEEMAAIGRLLSEGSTPLF